MLGALRRRRQDDELARDLALLTAFYAGPAVHADPNKLPPFSKWRESVLGIRKRMTREEAIARFDKMAARGLITRQ